MLLILQIAAGIVLAFFIISDLQRAVRIAKLIGKLTLAFALVIAMVCAFVWLCLSAYDFAVEIVGPSWARKAAWFVGVVITFSIAGGFEIFIRERWSDYKMRRGIRSNS